MQTLKGLELVGHARGQSASCDVADVTKQMLDAYLFRLLGLDDGCCVNESLGCCCAVLQFMSCQRRAKASTVYDPKSTYILDLVHRKVCICRHTSLLWLYVDDD